MNNSNPKILAISGVTCAGKNHLALAIINSGIGKQVISTTTRNPRQGEIDGIHYNFLGVNDFERKIGMYEFVEHVKIGEDYYGVSHNAISRAMASNKIAVVIVDPRGNRAVMNYADKRGIGALSVFIDCNKEEQINRLLDRYENDSLACAEKYRERIDHIANHEASWRSFMHYDLVIGQFDQKTQADVIGALITALNSSSVAKLA